MLRVNSEKSMCSLHSQYLNPVAEGDSATIHCLSQNAPERYKTAQGQKFYMGVTLGAVPFFPISSQRRKRCTIIGYDNVSELANVKRRLSSRCTLQAWQGSGKYSRYVPQRPWER